MHKTIIINGQEYELQISARKILNGGKTAVSMDIEETKSILSGVEEDLRYAIGIIDYAVEQRKYEASFEKDKETYDDMMSSSRKWESIGDRLFALLEGE